ncbi:hypothetical protein B484DRAFT_477405 [Ochromonadaceae sp. CCMP2298]|nr:hypothetical protein B484DRAFT_477405 [Ochromonadaceae sp. CCMP2298]
MLFGGVREKTIIARSLEGAAAAFAARWGCEEDSQEVRYMRVLVLLLRDGLAAAEAACTFTGVGESSSISGSSGTSESQPWDSISEMSAETETETETETEDYPVLSGGIGAVRGLGMPALRLFETYQGAFFRVVQMCMGSMGVMDKGSDLLNKEILSSFLTWEQSLRRSLTKDLWKQNPAELAGRWTLTDVPGNGDLKQVMTLAEEQVAKIRRQTKSETVVEFTQQGRVLLSQTANTGLHWFFRPGPAHLDTCEFFVRSGSKADLLLHFVGSIDRGQRIESRFSARPIRMSGRVLSIVKGEAKGNSRFVMELQRKSN